MKGAMGGDDLLGQSYTLITNFPTLLILGAADDIQKAAEGKLGGKFETVVALDDFAYKSHFKVSYFEF